MTTSTTPEAPGPARRANSTEIDARPSDAIAVAVTCDPPLPIYVSEDVLNDVMREQEEE